MPLSISILGAGSWGTALAILTTKNGCRTVLWGHSSTHMAALAKDRENKSYLPGLKLPDSLKLSNSLPEASSLSPIILLAVPSHAFKDTLVKIKPFLSTKTKIAWATKGFNPDNGLLLSHIVEQNISCTIKTAVLSGPTFSREVGLGLPTAITIASTNIDFANQLASILHNSHFRAYTNQDIIGVQVAGAVKNVLAIAAGIADGLGFGANTKSALITRGLQEISRLGTKLGGQPDTFMGLAGLGDLVLTCTDNQSRNRRFGIALGQGKNRADTIKKIGQEIEGIAGTRATHLLATKHNVEMPIIEQIYKVLYENLNPLVAVQNLLTREQKTEYP